MSLSGSSKLVLVTGANKGIGYGIVEKFLERSGYHILLATRDTTRGQDAVKLLQEKKNNLSTVEFLHLDVDDERSINAAAEQVKIRFRALDILINNAAIASFEMSYEVARKTIDTNYYGVLRMLHAFTPLLKEGSRIVNISSTMGQRALQEMSGEIRERFLSENLTIEKLNQLMEEYVTAVKDGSYSAKGWPSPTYSVSKSGLTMLGRLWTKEVKLNDCIVTSVCPGWIKTDLGGPNAPGTIEQAVVTPLHCAFLPKGSPNGLFWSDQKVQPYA